MEYVSIGVSSMMMAVQPKSVAANNSRTEHLMALKDLYIICT